MFPFLVGRHGFSGQLGRGENSDGRANTGISVLGFSKAVCRRKVLIMVVGEVVSMFEYAVLGWRKGADFGCSSSRAYLSLLLPCAAPAQA